MYHTPQNCMAEWSFTASGNHADPFNEITLDILVTGPNGEEQRVPAFWAGGQTWRVRYASPTVGTYHWRSDCSDPSDTGLHGREGTLEVTPYEGKNPLLLRGPLRVSTTRRHLEHIDGTPFFWLADTWWMALCDRLS